MCVLRRGCHVHFEERLSCAFRGEAVMCILRRSCHVHFDNVWYLMRLCCLSYFHLYCHFTYRLGLSHRIDMRNFFPLCWALSNHVDPSTSNINGRILFDFC
jgi:hypothetical protein